MPEDQTKPRNVLKILGPPNLQLGLSSGQFPEHFPKKGHETFIAAVVAVSIQLSLIAIATITVYHTRTRQSIGTEPQTYGYPCYITGSILLSMGVAICSVAVERSTEEHNWTVYPRVHQKHGRSSMDASSTERGVFQDKPDKSGKDHPRLLWLQQSQEVNDQFFNGYAVLAGPKHHIITSSRIEDMRLDPHPGSSASSKTKEQGDDDLEYVSSFSSRIR